MAVRRSTAGRAARDRVATAPAGVLRSAFRAALLLVAGALLGSCGGSSNGAPPAATPTPEPQASAAPWQRTEEREPCADFNVLRNPYFGDLHIHTAVSADAYIFGTRAGPRDAYDFAKGGSIAFSDDNEEQTRSGHLDRPLDFAAVTDHAEFFGEVNLCSTPGSPVYDIETCQALRQAENPDDRFSVTVQWLFPAGIPNPPSSLPFCSMPGIDCDAAAVSVWKEIQAAAEEAYDRSAACGFTSFIAYEHTASPLGRHLHRNIIFRNEHVPAFAASQLETAAGGIPQGVWTAVENDCLNAGTGCDALVIPHNSNLSGGQQWLDPADVTEAQRRQDLEPLVEIHQIKGNSECRFDRLAGVGSFTDDELCDFEQEPLPSESPGQQVPSIDQYPRRNMVRNTLKDGLYFEQTLGVNPFKLGFIGSTDNHDAASGSTEEGNWNGGQGNTDSSPARRISLVPHTNPGGLAVVWAEENSRDALFDALRRRETYATSGTRPVVRFFGGVLDGVDCDTAGFVENAYKTGTPMGGDLGAVRGAASPRFAVLAAKDPGTEQVPGTDLQRVQIIKGWVDAAGETHEKVFDVAGDPENGAGVDPDTCAPLGAGARELCAVWEDPEFDRSQRAFYYARVIENPTCRWSTLACKSVGVDPFSPDCAAQVATAGDVYANCCVTEDEDPFVQRTIQERAWTSPIWYRPEGIAAVEGGVEFGGASGADVLDLTVRIGAVPAPLDPQVADLTLRVSDNDDIYRVTIPAGALQQESPGSFSLPQGSIAGLRAATFDVDADGGGVLHVQTEEGDLSRADRVDHMVRVGLESGTYKVSYTRLWEAGTDRLAPVAQ